MLEFLLSYAISFCIVELVINLNARRYKKIENIEYFKNKIQFHSFNVHRVKIDGANVFRIDKRLYLKLGNKMVVITNAMPKRIVGEYLYFKGEGLVEIYIKFKFYEIFSLDIYSEKFDIAKIKRKAEQELFENLFDLKNCKNLIKYLKIVKKTLKIDVFNGKIVIKQNFFKIPFILSYKTNGKIKRIKVNQNY